MSSYFKAPARPVLACADFAELRAEPSSLLRTGQFATVAGDPDLFRYDEAETAADDGVEFFRPDDVDSGDPGRWVRFPVGASVADFSAHALHVNVGGASPTVGLYGLSVTFTLGANRRGLFWDAANASWAAAQDTLGDDAVISSYLPFRASVLTGEAFSAVSGPAASGLLRLAENDEVKARVGATTYRVVAALTGPTLAFGSDLAATVTIDAETTARVSSRLGSVKLRAATQVNFTDPSDANEALRVDVAAGEVLVKGVLDTLGASVLALGGSGNAVRISASGLKVESVADGVAADDAAAFGQIAAATQRGRATLVSGVTPAISATVTASSRITFDLADQVSASLSVKYAALDVDRVVGAPGSFKLTALVGAGTINVMDGSSLDWTMVG